MIRHLRKALKLLHLLKTKRYRNALRYGVGAAIEHTAVIKRLSPEFVIDAGANVGQFALLARQLHPQAPIIAFEPLAEAASVFEKVFTDDPCVTLHHSALGPQRTNADMHVSKRADSSSLLPIAARQSEQFPGTEEVGRETVLIAPLSDFVFTSDLQRRVLLKIDVQGFELEVLKSAAPLLPDIDWVYVEASFVTLYEGQALAAEVVRYLLQAGFDVQGIYNPSYDSHGLVVQADFLFGKTGKKHGDQTP